MWHKITNKNPSTLTGDCSICGEGIEIKWANGKRWACAKALRDSDKRAHDKARKLGKSYTKSRHHGLTVEEGKALRQKYACGICSESDETKLHVDHDHTTKEIRGVLCRRHNMGLGYFADSVEELESAIAYLKNPPLV